MHKVGGGGLLKLLLYLGTYFIVYCVLYIIIYYYDDIIIAVRRTGRPYGRTTRQSADGPDPRHVTASRRPSVITASDDYFSSNI